MNVTRIILLGLTAILSGCTIADDDRCLEGYTWDENMLACRKNPAAETDSDIDAGVDTETGSIADAGPDAGDQAGTDTEGPELPEGLGEPCTAGGNECAAYAEANFCALDPRKPDEPGVCTIENCKPGGCPPTYVCCDCFGVFITCAPEDRIGEASAMGCICI